MPRVLLFHPRVEEFTGPLRAAVPGLELQVAGDLSSLRRHLPEAEILLCTELPPEGVERTPERLRWIQLCSAGVDGLLPARDRIGNVVVTNARGIHAGLMADYALAVMVMLQWDFPGLLRDQAERRWRRDPKSPLAGKTLGVIGPGSIGAEIGRRAHEFGMNVLGVRRSGLDCPPGFLRMYRYERLDEVLPECDFVCITAPETPETRHMFGEKQFRTMKRTAFLLNISRGGLVDEAALIAALQEGLIAGAGLDVLEKEPPDPSNPLWTMPNVIITPHISGMTEGYAERVASLFAENFKRYLSGQPLRNVVDLERGY